MQINSLNRHELSSSDRDTLEMKVLPTARRWLRIPGLAHLGAATLATWGDPLVDDHGKPYIQGGS